MRFKIDWASFIVGSKFTAFALFYFVFEGNFPSTSHRRTYIWRGDLTESFLRYRFGGLFFGGAYTWRDLFSKFYGMRLLSVLWNSLRNDGFLKDREISFDVLFVSLVFSS